MSGNEFARYNGAQDLWVRSLSQAWHNNRQIFDPSVWLAQEPWLEEKMLRDADIAHAVNLRQGMIGGKNYSMLPTVPDDPVSQLSADVASGLLGNIARFTEARSLLSRAFFSGARYARIHGRLKRATYGDGVPRTWWVPTRLEDLDKRGFRVVPKLEDNEQGKYFSATWERYDFANRMWVPLTKTEHLHLVRHVYQDDQSTLGHGRALREALAWCWFAKTNAFADALAASGKAARGTLMAKIDNARDASTGLPNTEVVNAWVEVLQQTLDEHGVAVFDKDDQVEQLSNSGENWQVIEGLRADLKTTIATLILGSNLPTTADSGGSYALAEVQENSTEALVQLDRESLEEALTANLIGCVWLKNAANLNELGIAGDPPKINLTQEKIQDPKERAEVIEIAVRTGVPVATEDAYEQLGLRKPKAGEAVITAPQPVMTPGFGAPPSPGGIGAPS